MENGSFDLGDFPSRFCSHVEELPWIKGWSRLHQVGTKDILSPRDGSHTTTMDGHIISKVLEEEESIFTGWTREEESSKVKIGLNLQ